MASRGVRSTKSYRLNTKAARISYDVRNLATHDQWKREPRKSTSHLEMRAAGRRHGPNDGRADTIVLWTGAAERSTMRAPWRRRGLIVAAATAAVQLRGDRSMFPSSL